MVVEVSPKPLLLKPIGTPGVGVYGGNKVKTIGQIELA